MATSQELYEQISDLFLQFEAEHNSTTKAIGELKKLVTDYRKASVAENK